MIRVLHIVSSMNRGGLETFIMNVYRNIDKKKIQFDFLMHTDKECDYNEEINNLGGKIYSIPSRKHGLFKNRKELDRFFENHPEYKVVHQHVSSLSYIEPLKFAKKHKVPIRIIHSHSTRSNKGRVHKYLHKWNQIFVKSYATNYLACSETAAKWLYKNSMYSTKEFVIINNGINLNEFTFDNLVREKKRRELGVENSFVIGHVGRFAYPKNHDFLIDIFKELFTTEPTAKLLLVGNGELKSIIEEKALQFNLLDNIIFTGVRDDISELLQSMDVFVFPSKYEGLPVTLVEAQSTGLPCVISDVITDEVMITDVICKVPLQLNAEHWSEKVLEYRKGNVRKGYLQELYQSGFNIDETVEVLETLYI